jgi:hypothetical protein
MLTCCSFLKPMKALLDTSMALIARAKIASFAMLMECEREGRERNGSEVT